MPTKTTPKLKEREKAPRAARAQSVISLLAQSLVKVRLYNQLFRSIFKIEFTIRVNDSIRLTRRTVSPTAWMSTPRKSKKFYEQVAKKTYILLMLQR